jgi:hypothetical protein
MSRMPKKEWITEPCRRCGKTPRYDYDSYCMDCTDDLALRGLRAPRPDLEADLSQADPAPKRTPGEKAP